MIRPVRPTRPVTLRTTMTMQAAVSVFCLGSVTAAYYRSITIFVLVLVLAAGLALSVGIRRR